MKMNKRGRHKAVGEVISTVIIAATVIAISLAIFTIAIQSSFYSITTSTYGYIKSVFLSIANNIPQILQGNSYIASIPSGQVGIGFRNVTDKIEVDLLINGVWNNVTIANYTMALTAGVNLPAYTSSHLIFGVNNFTVNDLSFVPTVWEHYKNGWTYLNLNTSRIYVSAYKTVSSTGTPVYNIKITYVDLKVVFVTQPSSIMVIPGGTVYSKIFVNPSRIIVREISSNGVVLRKADLSGLLGSIYSTNYVMIVVYRISVVLA